MERQKYGEYNHLFFLLKEYEEKFMEYVRMSLKTFDYILNKIEPHCQRNWCHLHKRPIKAEERLVITLRFLATGTTYKALGFSFRLGTATVCQIVRETMQIIWNVFYQVHMPVPTTEHFKQIAEEFFIQWNFPHCLGAVDGKHIKIKNPANSGSLFFNYKHFFSIVLQALVDTNYKFIVIDVGGYGQQSDGGTFQESDLYKSFNDKSLRIPTPGKLPDSKIILPYFLIGDAAYPLTENLIKPYPGENLSKSKERFNKRLSRARRVVECAFGIITQKWRILLSTIYQNLENVDIIIKCICVLHNIIIDSEGSEQHLKEAAQRIEEKDNEMDYENEVVQGYGMEVREELRKYFDQHPIRF